MTIDYSKMTIEQLFDAFYESGKPFCLFTSISKNRSFVLELVML